MCKSITNKNTVLKSWKGTGVRPDVAKEVAEYVVKHANNIEWRGLVHKSIYSAIIELVANVTNHAYPSSEQYTAKPGEAWEILVIRNSTNFLSVFVQDFGISIPVSILNKLVISTSDNLQLKQIAKSDGLLIGEAVNIAAGFRGRGLKSISTFVDSHQISAFIIKSRKGTFSHFEDYAARTSTSENIEFNGTSVEVRINASRPVQ